MTILPLLALLFATRALASTTADKYISVQLANGTGPITKVEMAPDGSFSAPSLPPGAYKMEWTWWRASPGSAPHESPIPNLKVTFAVDYGTLSSTGTGKVASRPRPPFTVTKRLEKGTPTLRFEKIIIEKGDKITGRLQVTDASGAVVHLFGS